jgi:hypothetical protein
MTSKFKLLREFFLKLVGAKFLLFSYNVRREAEHAARAGLARLLIRTIMFFSQVPGPVLPPLRREAHA